MRDEKRKIVPAPRVPRGLIYQRAPGRNGHCLYHAVALYLGQDQADLRRIVAARLERGSDRAELRTFLQGQLARHQTVDQYIAGVHAGREWADSVEIEVLMRVLGRPIAIVSPDGSLRNPEVASRFAIPNPMFVLYNGHNHYDALLLDRGSDGLSILRTLQKATTATPPTRQHLQDEKPEPMRYNTDEADLALLYVDQSQSRLTSSFTEASKEKFAPNASSNVLVGPFLMLNEARFSEAARIYRHVIDYPKATSAQQTEAYHYLGLIHLYADDLQTAQAHLTRAYKARGSVEEDENLQRDLLLGYVACAMYSLRWVTTQQAHVVKILEDVIAAHGNDNDLFLPTVAVQMSQAYRNFLVEKQSSDSLKQLKKAVNNLLSSAYKNAKRREELEPLNALITCIGFCYLGLGQSREALKCFKQLVPMNYQLDQGGYLVSTATQIKGQCHYLYYLYRARNREKAVVCAIQCFDGLLYYPRCEALLSLLDRRLTQLIELTIKAKEENEPYLAALEQLNQFLQDPKYIKVLSRLPDFFRTVICRDLVSYLEAKLRFYEANTFLHRLAGRNQHVADMALYQESQGNFYYFYSVLLREELHLAQDNNPLLIAYETAIQHYEKILPQCSNDARWQRYVGGCKTKYALSHEQLILSNKTQRADRKQSSRVVSKAQRSFKVKDTNHKLNGSPALAMEAEGLRLFHERQDKASQRYFDNLLTMYPHSILRTRWQVYQLRLALRLGENDRVRFIKGELERHVTPSHVDLRLVILQAEHFLSGKRVISFALYDRIRVLWEHTHRQVGRPYLPVDRYYHAIKRRFLDIRLDECVRELLQYLEKQAHPALKTLLCEKQKLTEAEKVARHQINTFFKRTPDAEETLLRARSLPEFCRRLFTSLARNLPKKPGGRLSALAMRSMTAAELSAYINLSLTSGWGVMSSHRKVSTPSLTTQGTLFGQVDRNVTMQKPCLQKKEDCFYNNVVNCLNDEFTMARLVARRYLVLPRTQMVWEVSESLAIFGTQLTGISRVSAGLALAIKVLRVGSQRYTDAKGRRLAQRLVDFCGDRQDQTIFLAQQLAQVLTIMFQQQIHRLHVQDGLPDFARGLTMLMVSYIATDFGKEATLGSWFYHQVSSVVRSFGQLFSKSTAFPDNPNTQDKRYVLMQALFCRNLSSTTRLRQEDSALDVQDPWTLEELLLSAGFVTPGGQCYIRQSDSGHQKYGFRVIPSGLIAEVCRQLSYQQQDLLDTPPDYKEREEKNDTTINPVRYEYKQ